jgi:pimeloyl-ACP methyl ester carboxylesterase
MKIARVFRKTYPGLWYAIQELRAIPEVVRSLRWAKRSFLRSLPPGDGRPILVIPGFLCSDIATWSMRRFLKRLGYESFGWNQGVNWGPRPGVRTRLLHQINFLSQQFSQPVTLVGWSLGGVYARELSCIRPDLIREVITLGTPMQGSPESLSLWRVFNWINRDTLSNMSSSVLDYARPILGRNLAVFTRRDGIVPWKNCVPVRGQIGESIEVKGSHVGLISNPEVMTVLANHLSEDNGSLSPINSITLNISASEDTVTQQSAIDSACMRDNIHRGLPP